MVPMLAGEMLPYWVWKSLAESPTCCSMACRSFRSSSRRPLSSAILKTSAMTPDWVSFRFRMRLMSSGPISEIVARTGCPCSPKTSQKVTGQPAKLKSVRPNFFTRSCSFGIVAAGLADSGEVALHVGGKNRHADAAETFRHHLQGDGLARAGGAGDQAVPVRHAGQQVQRIVPLGDQKRVRHEILRGVGRLGDLLVR